jgi:hypothetical protein
VDGIRVMVNWCEGACRLAPDPLFDDDPDSPLLREGPRTALLSLLDAASRHDLLVDLTFYNLQHDGRPMPIDRYTAGLVATTHALEKYRNVLFDLQSEFDCKPSGVRAADAHRLRQAVQAADRRRLVTVSPCAMEAAQIGAFFAGRGPFAGQGAFPIAAFHDARQEVPDPQKTWHTLPAARAAVALLRQGMAGAGIAIYFQEPTAWGRDRSSDDRTPAHFTAAVRHAKAAGAAAWTFHQRAGFDLSRRSFLEQLADGAAPEADPVSVLRALRPAADGTSWGAGTLAQAVANP